MPAPLIVTPSVFSTQTAAHRVDAFWHDDDVTWLGGFQGQAQGFFIQ